jgi:hypothetical protein
MTVALLMLPAARASAEWQIKPFVGEKFGGSTTLYDPDNPENPGGGHSLIVGVNGGLLGEMFGIEGDFGYGPGFFSGSGPQVLTVGSNVITLTGNIVVAMPRRLTQYTLRPYFVGGAGFMHASISTVSEALPVASTMMALDFGGGATGFFTNRIGVNWELRHFRSVFGKDPGGTISLGQPERLSFWRAHVALAIRY